MTHELPCKFLMSNSSTDLVKESFKLNKIDSITCKRRINSKDPNAKTEELLITN